MRIWTTDMKELTYFKLTAPSSEANSHSASQEIPPPFIEPKGSLPCSQQPAIGPYPDPHAVSSQLPTLFP
jgi:hypothetical protein